MGPCVSLSPLDKTNDLLTLKIQHPGKFFSPPHECVLHPSLPVRPFSFKAWNGMQQNQISSKPLGF